MSIRHVFVYRMSLIRALNIDLIARSGKIVYTGRDDSKEINEHHKGCTYKLSIEESKMASLMFTMLPECLGLTTIQRSIKDI